jgi:REP element-mobilizing transposase RayT
MKQGFLHEQFRRRPLSFGGSLLKGNAREARPLSTKLPIHAVLKASASTRSMKTPSRFYRVNNLIRETAKKHGVVIHELANAGNHLHILISIPSRKGWSRFIKELSGRVAQLMSNAKRFWGQKPFTRVTSGWRKEFAIVKKYIARQHETPEPGLPHNWFELVDPKLFYDWP